MHRAPVSRVPMALILGLFATLSIGCKTVTPAGIAPRGYETAEVAVIDPPETTEAEFFSEIVVPILIDCGRDSSCGEPTLSMGKVENPHLHEGILEEAGISLESLKTTPIIFYPPVPPRQDESPSCAMARAYAAGEDRERPKPRQVRWVAKCLGQDRGCLRRGDRLVIRPKEERVFKEGKPPAEADLDFEQRLRVFSPQTQGTFTIEGQFRTVVSGIPGNVDFGKDCDSGWVYEVLYLRGEKYISVLDPEIWVEKDD